MTRLMHAPSQSASCLQQAFAVYIIGRSQVNKQTSELVFDHLHATSFQFSPLGRTILGPVENIKSINRDQLVSYMKTHYRGPRMVRLGAGA